MAQAIPAQSQIAVRVLTTNKTEPAIASRPLLSTATLCLRGFVFERHQLASRDLVPGRLLNAVVLLPLTGGVEARWRRDGLWLSAPTQKGTFVSFPAGAQMEGEWAGTLDALVFSFDRTECRRRIPELNIVPETELLPKTNAFDERLWHLALAEQAELEAGCPAGRLYADSLATAMSLSLFLRHGGPVSTPPEDAMRLQEALQHIREHIDEKLSLETLATVAHMSADNFRRLFKKTTGGTPHQYILRRRIDGARQLLAQPGLSIAEVAYAVGFSSQAHLTTAFRRFEGITPTSFRRQQSAAAASAPQGTLPRIENSTASL
jgi:AraC family transcriptional regulator